MERWDEHTDIVVVGSGAAGLSAAIEARRAGASVVVLEKMKVAGGNTRISDGALAAPGNYLQRRRAVDDSPELFCADLFKAGLGLNHPALVRQVAEQAAAAIDWTIEELGLRYLDRLDRFGGHSAARSLTTARHTGADLTRAQVARLRDLGVVVRTGCCLTDLLRKDGGALSGVRIQTGFDYKSGRGTAMAAIRARRAVVLATGGFANDLSFRQLQNPTLDHTIASTNHRGATAEGLKAALKIEAAPVHLSWIQTGPWGCADERGYGTGGRFASYAVFPFGILVDPATGGRIVDEWADRRRRSEAMFKAGHPCIGIVDAAGAAADAESLARCLSRGKVRSFHRLAALAEAYAMPVATLRETVAGYNEAVGRRVPDHLGKPLDKGARPLAGPPYYAIRLWPKVHYTPGGVAIDEQARVLDLDGRPIAGLLAAGEVCGGVHGASRLGSCALTDCLVFGRIAGRQAASSP